MTPDSERKHMNQEIDPIPLPVPPRIIEALNSEKLVIFLGAGISRLAGSKSWKDLAGNLVKRCYETKNASGKGCITFREKETLLCETDHKKTSLFKRICGLPFAQVMLLDCGIGPIQAS